MSEVFFGALACRHLFYSVPFFISLVGIIISGIPSFFQLVNERRSFKILISMSGTYINELVGTLIYFFHLCFNSFLDSIHLL